MSPGLELRLKCTEPGLGDYDKVSFEFGEIQSVSTRISSSVKQSPIVIYGFRNSLCMDSGVTKGISVSFVRINPSNPKDSDTDKSDRWSNAKWLEAIQEILNHWQARTSGFNLTIKNQFKDCYPNVTSNVFISSISLPKSNKTSQVISGQISFKVGVLKTSDVPSIDEFIITYNPQEDYLSPFADSGISGSRVPIAYPPKDWVKTQIYKDKVFSGWASIPGTTQIAYNPEDILTLNSSIEVFAVWLTIIPPVIFTDVGKHVHRFGKATKRAKIYCIGGGGAGGTPVKTPSQDQELYVGGGGGSGGICIKEIDVIPESEINLFVGAGGIAGDITGGSGGESYFEYNGTKFTAKGGWGGRYNFGGTGGASNCRSASWEATGYSGGRSGHISGKTFIKGTDGDGGKITIPDYDIPDLSGLAGNGKVVSIVTSTFGTIGGGGGGAISLSNVQPHIALMAYNTGTHGGNGGGAYGETTVPKLSAGTDGIAGGGGGGGGAHLNFNRGDVYEISLGGNGGSGFIIVEEFYD